VPPETAEGYKINVPESLKGKIDGEALTKDAGFKADIAKLHAAGASQKVVDAARATVLERGMAMREALPMLQASDCEAALRQVDGWKNDQEYIAQMQTAFSAGSQIFGKAFAGMEARATGTTRTSSKAWPASASEMAEDRGPSPEALQQANTNLDALMASPAYTNPNHPQHADTVAKVTALTAQVTGNKPVAAAAR
jgi:hypothetical protein